MRPIDDVIRDLSNTDGLPWYKKKMAMLLDNNLGGDLKYAKELLREIAKLKFWELQYWRKASKVIAMSEEDKQTMISQVPTLNVDIVPNGVDTNYFSTKIIEKSLKIVKIFHNPCNFLWLNFSILKIFANVMHSL